MKFFRKKRTPRVDLKTGLINLRAEGAPELIRHLQAMADAAGDAAEKCRRLGEGLKASD